ncbi:MAG: glutathione S-transferase family protein [bacterium]
MTRAKLYFSRNLNPRLCVAVSRYLGADLDYVENSSLTPDQRQGFDHLNPMGRFPVLQQPDGSTLWETDAIICQLSRQLGSDLWRRDETEPQMIRWLSWTAYHLMPSGDVHYFEQIVRPTFSDQPELPQIMEQSMRNFRQYGALLNDWLTGKDWLVGDHISYADFRVATLMPFARAALLPVDDYPQILRHAAQLEALPYWTDPFAGL